VTKDIRTVSRQSAEKHYLTGYIIQSFQCTVHVDRSAVRVYARGCILQTEAWRPWLARNAHMTARRTMVRQCTLVRIGPPPDTRCSPMNDGRGGGNDDPVTCLTLRTRRGRARREPWRGMGERLTLQKSVGSSGANGVE